MIPLASSVVCEILNLDAKIGNKPLFGKHQNSVLSYLKSNTDEGSYNLATTETTATELTKAFDLAYSLIMLHKTIDFLNLNTAGTGIIKKTGFDNQSTELLNGNELLKFKKTLELRALNEIEPYLNENGKRLIYGLNPSIKRVFRSTLI